VATRERETGIVGGIAGWVDFGRDLRAERPAIEAMTATMVNRGPDAGGVWCCVHAAIREVLYLGLTRWLPLLLDRKDRLSMACGLEVRVPFTDHRLVQYVWNVPWAMKEAGGREKGLLRTAAAGLLPANLLGRRNSIYPGAADQAYARAIHAQLRDLLKQPSASLFDLIDRERLAVAYERDPRLPGFMAIQPSSTAPIGFLLDVNRWLERSGVTIR
jgi:asparagine synthase (glutamine-hydrolysing)